MQETKSISNDVVNLSDLIADKILKQAPLKQTQISKGNYIPVVPDYLSNTKISFLKKPKIFAKKIKFFLIFSG